MELKVCVEFLYKLMPELDHQTNQTLSFNPKKIPRTVECPPNCELYAIYFIAQDTLKIAGKSYAMETNKLGKQYFKFNESDPKHLPHELQVADMLKRTKLPHISTEGPVQLVHYFACDNNVHPEYECENVTVVKSNLLQDLIIPENANRFETFDRYVFALNMDGELVNMFSTDKINCQKYYIGRLIEVDGKTKMKRFETVDGRPGILTPDEVLLDPSDINENGQILPGGYGTNL